MDQLFKLGYTKPLFCIYQDKGKYDYYFVLSIATIIWQPSKQDSHPLPPQFCFWPDFHFWKYLKVPLGNVRPPPSPLLTRHLCLCWLCWAERFPSAWNIALPPAHWNNPPTFTHSAKYQGICLESGYFWQEEGNIEVSLTKIRTSACSLGGNRPYAFYPISFFGPPRSIANSDIFWGKIYETHGTRSRFGSIAFEFHISKYFLCLV